jgi:hypothetical protein
MYFVKKSGKAVIELLIPLTRGYILIGIEKYYFYDQKG